MWFQGSYWDCFRADGEGWYIITKAERLKDFRKELTTRIKENQDDMNKSLISNGYNAFIPLFDDYTKEIIDIVIKEVENLFYSKNVSKREEKDWYD